MPRLTAAQRNAGTRINPGLVEHRWSCALCEAHGVATSRLRAAIALEAHHTEHLAYAEACDG